MCQAGAVRIYDYITMWSTAKYEEKKTHDSDQCGWRKKCVVCTEAVELNFMGLIGVRADLKHLVHECDIKSCGQQ